MSWHACVVDRGLPHESRHPQTLEAGASHRGASCAVVPLHWPPHQWFQRQCAEREEAPGDHVAVS